MSEKKEFAKLVMAYSMLCAIIICSIVAAATIVIHAVKTLLLLVSQQCAFILIAKIFGIVFLVSLIASVILCGIVIIILGYIYKEFCY